ncbi:MAG TPA: DNA adenine methylase [Acidimicrobiales bacterium]|nr:DNA adenine methylase [Acidimicrobiales bacterium]
MIKYLGSKRRLVPVLTQMLVRSGARTALDLFTGTTRVAQAFKSAGALVTAVDSTFYAETLAGCYVSTDANAVDTEALAAATAELDALPGAPGYFTETFCRRSRFFQPANGARVDAVRCEIERKYRGHPFEPILLTSLMEAADRVDSTTGVQMAYVKEWAERSYRPLELRVPHLLSGSGRHLRGDACELVCDLGEFDLAYLDPPYNQHRYEANYHIWETLVAWDSPEHYGVACKRAELRSRPRSLFNSRRTIGGAIAKVVRDVRAEVVILSYNDESWVTLEELVEICLARGHVQVLEFESDRYVGARIGIYNNVGKRVGSVGRLRNVEYVLVAGERATVRRIVEPWTRGRGALVAS